MINQSTPAESLNDALNRIALDIKPCSTLKDATPKCRRAGDQLPNFKQQFELYIANNALTNEQYALLLSNAVQITSNNYVSQKQRIKQMIDRLKNSSQQSIGVQNA